MLFTTIRDFFVQHVFGGISSTGTAYNVGRVGRFLSIDSGNKLASGNDYFIPVKGAYFDGVELSYINACDWLSTTATIVSMIAILIIICLFIKWIFKVVSGAIILR